MGLTIITHNLISLQRSSRSYEMTLASLAVASVCCLVLQLAIAHPQTLVKRPVETAVKAEGEWPCPGTNTACYWPQPLFCCSGSGMKCCGEKKGYCCSSDQNCGTDETGCVKQDDPVNPPILQNAPGPPVLKAQEQKD